MSEVEISGFKVNLIRKDIKHMYLRLYPGEIRVSAPKNMEFSQIASFVESRREWILKNYTSDDYYIWGQKYNFKETEKGKVRIKDNTIYAPSKKKLDDYYRQELKTELDRIYDKCVNIVGVEPGEIKIRKMKNWGNCNRQGRITLNLNLAKKEKRCLEYVFIHELCHLIEFNHGKEFKKLMDRFCPDWRETKKLLNR